MQKLKSFVVMLIPTWYYYCKGRLSSQHAKAQHLRTDAPRVFLACVNDRLRSRKENGRNRIAGAGMHVQLVIVEEAVIGTCPSW